MGAAESPDSHGPHLNEEIQMNGEIPIQCPYCGSPFDTTEGLSKHIDRLHEESGVLEGDYRKMMK